MTSQEDEDCDLDHGHAHADPVALVREYVQRDADGQFLRADAWFNSAMECPGHQPGWDESTLVRGFEITPLAQATDSARVLVTYARVAHLVQGSGSRVLRDEGVERDTFLVVHTPFGWRIAAPSQNQRVMPRTALKKFGLRGPEKAFVEGLIKP